MISTLVKSLVQRFRTASSPRRQPRPLPRSRPMVEVLEERVVLDGGELDPTFAGGAGTGLGLINFGNNSSAKDGARRVAYQGDKMIVVGSVFNTTNSSYDFLVTRLNPDGTVDSTFGTNGKIITNFSSGTETGVGGVFKSGNDYATDVVVQPDGKIVVVGTSNANSLRFTTDATRANWVVARWDADGKDFDRSFNGGQGFRTINFAANNGDHANAVALISPTYGGGIVVVGSAQITGGDFDFAVAYLNADGSMNTGFSGDGLVNTDFGNNVTPPSTNDEMATAVVVRENNILAIGLDKLAGQAVDGSGYSPLGGSTSDWKLVSYDATGTVRDITTTDFGGNDIPLGAASLFDYYVFVGGATGLTGSEIFDGNGNPTGRYTISNSSAVLAKYTWSPGSFNEVEFSSNFIYNPTSRADLIADVAVDLVNGDVIGAGTRGLDGGGVNGDFLAMRFDPYQMQLNPSFSSDGIQEFGFGGASAEDVGAGVAIASDGKMTMVGVSKARGPEDVAVARLQGDRLQFGDFVRDTDGSPNFTAMEGAGVANVIVKRVGGTTGSVSVQIQAQEETAILGRDYNAPTQTITFGAGETSKTVQVPVVNNSTVDGTRTFRLVLHNAAQGGFMGSVSLVRVTILDDDQPAAPVESGAPGLVPVVAKQGKKWVVNAMSSAGTLRRRFGPYPGKVTARMRDVNRNGIPEMVITIVNNGIRRQFAYDSVTLAKVPMPKKR